MKTYCISAHLMLLDKYVELMLTVDETIGLRTARKLVETVYPLETNIEDLEVNLV